VPANLPQVAGFDAPLFEQLCGSVNLWLSVGWLGFFRLVEAVAQQKVTIEPPQHQIIKIETIR